MRARGFAEGANRLQSPALGARRRDARGIYLSGNFKSDNVTPVCDAIMAAINAANVGSMASYGGDEFTERCAPPPARYSARRWPFSP